MNETGVETGRETGATFQGIPTGVAAFVSENLRKYLRHLVDENGGMDRADLLFSVSIRLFTIIGSNLYHGRSLVSGMKGPAGKDLSEILLEKLITDPDIDPSRAVSSSLETLAADGQEYLLTIVRRRVERFFRPAPPDSESLATPESIRVLEDVARLRFGLEDRVFEDFGRGQRTPPEQLLESLYKAQVKINLDDEQLRVFEDGVITYQRRVEAIERVLVELGVGYPEGRHHPAEIPRNEYFGMALARTVLGNRLEGNGLEGPILLELEPTSIHLVCRSDKDYEVLYGCRERVGNTGGFVVTNPAPGYRKLAGLVAVERGSSKRIRRHERRHTLNRMSFWLRMPYIEGRIRVLEKIASREWKKWTEQSRQWSVALTEFELAPARVQGAKIAYEISDQLLVYLNRAHDEILAYAADGYPWSGVKRELLKRETGDGKAIYDYGRLVYEKESDGVKIVTNGLAELAARLAEIGIKNAAPLVEEAYEGWYFGAVEKAIDAYKRLEWVYALEGERNPRRLVMGVLDPFHLEQWPALARLVGREHQKTMALAQILEEWESWVDEADIVGDFSKIARLVREGREGDAAEKFISLVSTIVNDYETSIQMSVYDYELGGDNYPEADSFFRFVAVVKRKDPFVLDQSGGTPTRQGLFEKAARHLFGDQFVDDKLAGSLRKVLEEHQETMEKMLGRYKKVNVDGDGAD